MSHGLLDDLLVDVPRHVTPDPGSAWRAGTKRRRRRYAAEGLAAAIAVGLVGLGLVRLHDETPIGPIGQEAVTGHPVSVPRPFVQEDLPRRPGPLAGVVETAEGWFAVDAAGRSWRLPATPDHVFALSDDGTRLGYLRQDSAAADAYLTRDLVTGEVTSYPSIGEGLTLDDVPSTDQPYSAAPQYAAYWSPDGSRLLLPGGSMSESFAGALVLEDGEVHEVRAEGYPVGWASPSALVWLGHHGREVRVTDLSGAVVQKTVLEATPRLSGFSQWSGRVSPDGTRLVVVERPRDGQTRAVAYSMATGAFDRSWQGDEASPSCQPMWHDDSVALWYEDRLLDLSGQQLIQLDDRWEHPTCAIWAADALSGPTQSGPGLKDWRYWPFLWHWPWLLGVVMGAALALVLWMRRGRASRSPGRAT